jgi:hypothetical protein
MAQLKYKETQRLRQWDLMALIGIVIVSGVFALIQVLLNGPANRNILLLMALGILILSGVFYYLNSIQLIAKYNKKSIKLSMMPVGTVKRKIKWEDVITSEIVELPRESRWTIWNAQLTSLDKLVSNQGSICLHLKLKNNEEINIGCSNPQELKDFVDSLKELHPNINK